MKLTNTTLIECASQSRISSRSVSWSATGEYLAMASSDKMARLFTIDANASSAREVLVVSGHTAPVHKCRFHPSTMSATQLCTAATDGTVRIWDVRGATQRAIGKIEVAGPAALAVEWCGNSRSPELLCVTERGGTVCIYDVRKLPSSTSTASTSRSGRSAGGGALNSFALKPRVLETCIFSPDGGYMVAGSTVRREGMADVDIWALQQEDVSAPSIVSYPAHSGPIYAMSFSPSGNRLATGGADASIGLWDTKTMCCTHAISRRTKFVCGLAFSGDSRILASCGEEDEGVDLADASTGEQIGLVNLGQRPKSGGAEEIAWHPKEYLLACAKSTRGLPPQSPVTVAKLTIGSSQ